MINTTPYTNIHTHQEKESGILTITSKYHNFEKMDNGCYYSIGLHPWYLDKENIQQGLSRIEQFASNTNILAIGECGLDKVCTSNWELQKEVFISQIKIAEKIKKPIIVHCVKAFDELIKIKKGQNIKVPMIIHGYNNNQQIASELIKNGLYLSFGKALLNENSNASLIIRTTPLHHLFLETDDADISIKTIFDAASKHLQMNEAELATVIYNNFKTVFHNE